MDSPETVTTMSIEIPHPEGGEPSSDFIDAVSELFDAVASLVFFWASDKDIDPLVSAITQDADSETPQKTDPPPENTLAREADESSKHDIVITILGNELIVVCDTCEDEIGAKQWALPLNELLHCIDLHRNGPQ
jgi:hypothetical protein